MEFVKGVISRFGVPNIVNTNNGSQFTSGAFVGYYNELGITVYAMPQPHTHKAMGRLSMKMLKY
jgi:hypothetical protein